MPKRKNCPKKLVPKKQVGRKAVPMGLIIEKVNENFTRKYHQMQNISQQLFQDKTT